MLKYIILLFQILFTLNIFGQTTYTSNPAIGTYTSCPTNDYGYCAGWYIHGDGVLKIRLYEVTSTDFVFRIRKCSNTFSSSGTAWIKENGVCGTVIGNSYDYSSGIYWFSISVPIPSGFTSGSRDYYVVIHPEDGSNDGFYAGPVTITAMTQSSCSQGAFITLTVPDANEVMYQGDPFTITWNSSFLGSSCPVAILYQVNEGSWQAITTSTPDDGSYPWTIPSNINSTNVDFRIGYVEPDDNGNSIQDYSNNCSILPSSCSEGSTINITGPVPWEVINAGTTFNVTWSGSLQGSTCPVAISYRVDNGSWQNIASSTSDDGSYPWTVPSNINSTDVDLGVVYTTLDNSGNPVGDVVNGFTIESPGCPDPYEPNDSYATATTNAFSTLGESNYDATITDANIDIDSDADYYKINFTNDGIVTVNLSSLPANYELELWNSSYTDTLGTSINTGSLSESVSVALEGSGYFYIKIYSHNNSYSDCNTYYLNVDWCPEADPNSFDANNITQSSFNAFWDPVGSASGYNINVKLASDPNYNNPVFTGNTNTNSITVTGLSPNTTYKYQIQTDCNSLNSTWSPFQ